MSQTILYSLSTKRLWNLFRRGRARNGCNASWYHVTFFIPTTCCTLKSWYREYGSYSTSVGLCATLSTALIGLPRTVSVASLDKTDFSDKLGVFEMILEIIDKLAGVLRCMGCSASSETFCRYCLKRDGGHSCWPK